MNYMCKKYYDILMCNIMIFLICEICYYVIDELQIVLKNLMFLNKDRYG